MGLPESVKINMGILQTDHACESTLTFWCHLSSTILLGFYIFTGVTSDSQTAASRATLSRYLSYHIINQNAGKNQRFLGNYNFHQDFYITSSKQNYSISFVQFSARWPSETNKNHISAVAIQLEFLPPCCSVNIGFGGLRLLTTAVFDGDIWAPDF